MSEGREPESSFASENIRRRGRDADVKRERVRERRRNLAYFSSALIYILRTTQ